MELSWKDKKNRICSLIKALSDHHGGDELTFLRDYCKEVIELHKTCIDKALFCFEMLASDYNLHVESTYPDKRLTDPLKTNICEWCKFVPPFCMC
jgi:hypothetical protein